jgi:ATPase family associated with various cellular activities (AAA)
MINTDVSKNTSEEIVIKSLPDYFKIPVNNLMLSDLKIQDSIHLMSSMDPTHMINMVAMKLFNSLTSFTHLSDIRVRALISFLKTQGTLEIVNYINTNDDRLHTLTLAFYQGYTAALGTFKLQEYKVPDVFIHINNFTKTPGKTFSEFKDEMDEDDTILVSENVRLIYKPDNSNIAILTQDILNKCQIDLNYEEIFVEMIVQTPSGLTTQRVSFDFEYSKDDLELHYGENFNVFNDKLIERLTKKAKGIVMLHGPPGNGKTHYIRRLLSTLCDSDKRIILIPRHILGALETPAFNMFMLQNFVGDQIVFIIEDAESIIANKSADGSERSELVSTILNITDGILNDIFNIQVVLTFNTTLKEIDKALIRKGRLLAKYEFKNLSYESAEKLAKHLGVELKDKKESYSLAEIYALQEIDDDDILMNFEQKVQKEKLGF